MAVSLTLLAALAVLGGSQTPQAGPQVAPQTPTTQLEDVEVTARARANRAREFVGRVAAPSRNRGLGRWRFVCPGVVNLEREAAQAIANRIATVASDLGIEVLEPGCTANILVVFTSDASAVAQAMVQAEPRVYHIGVGALNRGAAALRDYQTTDAPVRWWLLSVPIDSETGQRAVRVPGDRTGAKVDGAVAAALGCNPDDCVIGAAPIIMATSASRLQTQVLDQLYKAIIIVDMDQAAGLNTDQLGDYLSMVSLVQIDPEGDTSGFDTVLNLFDNPTGVAGLTEWDESYMKALYGSPSRRRSVGAQRGAVAAIMNQTARARTTAE